MLHTYMNLEKISNSYLSQYEINYIINQTIWRSKQYILWTLNQVNLDALRTKYSNENYAMWSGSYGIPLLYIQSVFLLDLP